MSEVEIHQKEVDDNYDYFKSIIDKIISEHHGEYVLIKNKSVTEYFTTYNDAIKAGDVLYKDKLYSVQKVEKKSINLGFFSYA